MRLRRILWAAVALMAVALPGWTAPVSPASARQTALRFAQGRGLRIVTEAMPAKTRRTAGRGGQITPYYIYNMADGGGYVIVSGDDRTPQILGYTDHGSYDAAAQPAALQALLDGYGAQIAALDSLSAAASGAPLAQSAVAEPSRHYVAPLLTTLWNQHAPYNNQCPYYNNSDGSASGKRALTGCVATALGQVMAYYRYPNAVKTEIPSYSFTSGGKSITVDKVPSGTAIDWPNILDSYTAGATTAQQNAVAGLMAILGTGVSMAYGSQSAANLQNGIQLLYSHLGYDESIRYVRRLNYTQSEWISLLYTELAAGRPVAYRANSASSGHAFVIDGYDSADLFHVNWGWGGTSNGFFRISVLYSAEPGSMSTAGALGYAFDQEAIVGITPDDGVDSGRQAVLPLTARSISVSGNTVTAVFTNFSGATQMAYAGLGYVQDDGTVSMVGSTFLWLRDNYESTENFTVKGLADGVYRLVPVCRAMSESVWQPCGDDTAHEYVKAVVSGGKVTLTLCPADESQVAVTSWAYPGTLAANVQQTVRATLTTSAGEYDGTLYCFANNSYSNKGTAKSRAGVAIVPGRSNEVSFYFTPTAAGTWHIWITKDQAGSQVVGHTTVAITAAGAQQQNLSVANVIYDNMVSNVVYGHARRGQIVINNKAEADFDGRLVVKLYSGAIGSSSMNSLRSQLVPVRVAAGQQVRVPFTFDGLAVDYKYGLRIFYEGEKAVLDNNQYVIYSRSQRAGIISYSAAGTTTAQAPAATVSAGEAAAVDMRGVTAVSRVTPSANPNALYLLDADAQVPEGLDGCNVVRGSVADCVTLTDGYAVAIPAAFTATQISYTRKMATAPRSEDRWETLLLPFAPTSVTNAGTPVAIDGSLWQVRSFAGTDAEGRPVLSPVSDIEAMTPYVVKADGALSGATLTFSAQGARVQAQTTGQLTTDAYSMVGSTLRGEVASFYPLNGHGNAFDYHDGLGYVAPFRAYFKPSDMASYMPESIVIEGVASAIDDLTLSADGQRIAVYSVSGGCVGSTVISGHRPDMSGFAPGVYIVGGKKIVR